MKDFAEGLYQTCREVELAIVGHPPELAAYWARSNSIRHSHTVRELVSLKRGATLRVLNASGLSCGHQDFAISRFLRRLGISFEWTALESARSPYLEHPEFRRLVFETGVSIRHVDYSSLSPLAFLKGEFDAILFTEIAEHLDHSAFLRSLSAFRPLLANEGRLIVTTRTC